jgi:hypothetical protein
VLNVLYVLNVFIMHYRSPSRMMSGEEPRPSSDDGCECQMMEINGSSVAETWIEYAVSLDGAIVECDDEHEAEYLARLYDNALVLQRRIYVSEWDE